MKTWGRGWVVLVVRTKWRDSRRIFHSFHGDLLSKNMVRTAWGRTTSAVWSIFADLNRPLSPKLPDKDALSIHRPRLACFSLFSNLELFWRNNKTIIEFGFPRIWRILHAPRWTTPYSICRTLHILLSLIQWWLNMPQITYNWPYLLATVTHLSNIWKRSIQVSAQCLWYEQSQSYFRVWLGVLRLS